MAQERSTGVVRWFSDQKGFGFITPNEGGEDLFVHQSSIKSDGFRSLGEGETVEFQIVLGEDGRTKAVDVTGPDGSSVQGSKRDNYGGGGGGGIASEEIMAAAAAVVVEEAEAEVVIPAVAVAVVITVVIMGTWLGIALWKAAALVGSVVAEVEAVEGLVAVAVDATTVDRKGILLENALTLTHRDEGKRGVIVYILFFPASSKIFFPV
ncbi:unnamed protein product, partial [Vitis vinifera]